MTSLPGTNISAPIVPQTASDTYPTHAAQYGRGGWRAAATIADRDAIPPERLEDGSVVYVVSERLPYVWVGGAWLPFAASSGGGGGITGITVEQRGVETVSGATTLNFAGATVRETASGTARIEVSSLLPAIVNRVCYTAAGHPPFVLPFTPTVGNALVAFYAAHGGGGAGPGWSALCAPTSNYWFANIAMYGRIVTTDDTASVVPFVGDGDACVLVIMEVAAAYVVNGLTDLTAVVGNIDSPLTMNQTRSTTISLGYATREGSTTITTSGADPDDVRIINTVDSINNAVGNREAAYVEVAHANAGVPVTLTFDEGGGGNGCYGYLRLVEIDRYALEAPLDGKLYARKNRGWSEISTAAAGSPVRVSARYWRWRLIRYRNGGNKGWGACLAAFRQGGAIISTGGAPISSVPLPTDIPWAAVAAFDGASDANHGWYSGEEGGAGTGWGAWLGYDFGEPVAPDAFEFAQLTGYGWTMPWSIALDYSDDGIAWSQHTLFELSAGTDGVVQSRTIPSR